MPKVYVTKEFSFAYAHLLPNHSGKCRNLHGHNAKLVVKVSGQVNYNGTRTDEGMVMDFGDLKKIVNEAVVDKWDHKFLAKGDEWVVDAAHMYMQSAPAPELVKDFAVVNQIVLVHERSTAENLVKCAFRLIEDALHNARSIAKLEEVTFYETDTSYATITADSMEVNTVQG